MSVRLVRSRIGLHRLNKNVNPTQADYTLSIRDQMKSIEDNLSEIIRQVRDAGPELLLEALRPTYQKSQEYCPIDEGDLRGSGYFEARKVGNNTILEMGYGKGGRPHYAVYVHERTDLKHAAPTRAKWLQVALEEDAGEIRSRIEGAYSEFIA